MCSKKQIALFRASSAETLSTFSWEGVVEELEKRAPTLHTLLKKCVR